MQMMTKFRAFLSILHQSSNIFDLDGAHDAKGPSSRPERCPALYFA